MPCLESDICYDQYIKLFKQRLLQRQKSIKRDISSKSALGRVAQSGGSSGRMRNKPWQLLAVIWLIKHLSATAKLPDKKLFISTAICPVWLLMECLQYLRNWLANITESPLEWQATRFRQSELVWSNIADGEQNTLLIHWLVNSLAASPQAPATVLWMTKRRQTFLTWKSLSPRAIARLEPVKHRL